MPPPLPGAPSPRRYTVALPDPTRPPHPDGSPHQLYCCAVAYGNALSQLNDPRVDVAADP